MNERQFLINELKTIFRRRYGICENKDIKDKHDDFIKQIKKMNIKELNNAIANMTH